MLHPRTRGLLAITAIGVWLAAAGPASADDFYVDLDGNPATTGCTVPEDPCDQISEAISAAAANGAATPDTIHVGGHAAGSAYGPFAIPDIAVTLNGVYDNYVGVGPGNTFLTARPMLDGGTNTGVEFAAGSSPRELIGMTVRGGDTAGPSQSLHGLPGSNGIRLFGNGFDDTRAGVEAQVRLEGGPPQLPFNQFFGPDNGSATTTAITYTGTGSLTASDVGIYSLHRGFDFTGAGAGSSLDVDSSVIQDLTGSGSAISVTDASVRLSAIDIFNNDPTVPANGIELSSSTPTGVTSWIDDIRIRELNGDAIDLATPDDVSINRALLVENGDIGLTSIKEPADPGHLTVKNSTIAENGGAHEVLLDDTDLTLDSTMIGSGQTVADGIAVVDSIPGASSCQFAYTRGPINGTPENPSDCNDFQTTAVPVFDDNAPFSDYVPRYDQNPTLIDMGNPNLPEGRYVADGIRDGICLPRRDIGYGEFEFTTIGPSLLPIRSDDCTRSSIGSQPPPTTQVLPLSSGPTGKRAAALKKCKKKRSAEKRKRCRARARKLPV